MQIFLLLNFSDELQPQTRFNEQIQIHIEAAHHSADFNHSVFGAVAGLAENMGRGLRFLYAHTDSASPDRNLGESIIKITIIRTKKENYENKNSINPRPAANGSDGRSGTDRDFADYDYSNRQRASKLQSGECGNRFIQLYCIWILSIQ